VSLLGTLPLQGVNGYATVNNSKMIRGSHRLQRFWRKFGQLPIVFLDCQSTRFQKREGLWATGYFALLEIETKLVS